MSNIAEFQTSEIINYYKNKSIFITGATGFLGKVLIEKLLRSCYDLKKIYILVRHKKGNTPTQRLNELFNCKLFETLSQYYPDFRDKVEAIEGDLCEPYMGISTGDQNRLVENVNIVFHSAATVRFDEPLKVAVGMNIIGTKKVIDLSKQMKNLEALVHVSTAYANCDRQHISEVVYNPPVQPEKIIEAVDWIEEDLVKLLTPKVIKHRPNTYTYTKAIAETLVIQECKDKMPCTIVRPSIVGASWREPFPGWIDNFNGPTALFAAIGKGILRTMIGNGNSTADIIPVDIPVNMMIVAGWYTGAKKAKDIKIYNCTTGQINRLTWGMVERYCEESLLKNPLENIFLVPRPKFTNYRMVKFFRHFFEEMIPSYVMDFYLKIIHKKPIFVRVQSKIKKAVETLEFFTSTEWEFTNDNIFFVSNEMNEVDKRIFNIDVKDLHWRSYIEQYCLGTKKYLLKEDMGKVNKCRKELKK
ncbi:fatty acyl- reductase 1-like [Brachionus plicatilis]|uniref:Fatty acyl-CoA reductase n=1 Tax=Brachionus plicatilis TaxID=10195 RepID=A0A3M7QY18_BRAPC|nr:fatty acyl- reductase 1-like [Brachionus plicatilis]